MFHVHQHDMSCAVEICRFLYEISCMRFGTTTCNFRFLNKFCPVCVCVCVLMPRTFSIPLFLSLPLPPSLTCMIYLQVGEMFIVCGVLYAIDSVTERNTKILLALDLYRGYVLNDINLSFTNPFKNTTMALYNPETKVFLICFCNVYTLLLSCIKIYDK